MYKYIFLNWPTCESPPLTSVKLDHTPENQVLVDGACYSKKKNVSSLAMSFDQIVIS